MAINRREFLKRGAGMAAVGVVLPELWLREGQAQTPVPVANRRLVVIQFHGGNDALNTVVPYSDSRYRALRPVLGLQEAELRDGGGASMLINDRIGFHPSLTEFKRHYDAGRAAVILGVGYPNASLSHFLSMDIWHTAELSGLTGKGWLGKYADVALVNRSGLPAAAIGGELPKSLFAGQVVIPNVINFGLFNFITDPNYPGDSLNQLSAFNYGAGRAFPPQSLLGRINATARQSVSGAQRVQSAISNYTSRIVYPDNNPLAVALKMVAQLITTIPETALTYVQLGGFDTHADQIDRPGGRPNRVGGWHAVLLHWFSEAVDLFYRDLELHGLADDVLMMQWSEFGRRPGENASFGTDHGSAGSVMVIGNGVRGGVYGEHPSLAASALDGAGNPGFGIDFREVYATILDRWLGTDSRLILGGQFANVGFLG